MMDEARATNAADPTKTETTSGAGNASGSHNGHAHNAQEAVARAWLAWRKFASISLT